MPSPRSRRMRIIGRGGLTLHCMSAGSCTGRASRRHRRERVRLACIDDALDSQDGRIVLAARLVYSAHRKCAPRDLSFQRPSCTSGRTDAHRRQAPRAVPLQPHTPSLSRTCTRHRSATATAPCRRWQRGVRPRAERRIDVHPPPRVHVAVRAVIGAQLVGAADGILVHGAGGKFLRQPVNEGNE